MTDALDSLKSTTAPTAKTEAPAGESVIMDYQARTGADEAHEHEGVHVFMLASGDMYAVHPGLNIVPFAIAAELEGDRRLSEVDLDELRVGRKMHELSKRTMAPDALELLLKFELARPVSAGPRERRDGRLVDLLTSRVQRSMQASKVDVSNIRQEARSRTQVAQPRA